MFGDAAGGDAAPLSRRLRIAKMDRGALMVPLSAHDDPGEPHAEDDEVGVLEPFAVPLMTSPRTGRSMAALRGTVASELTLPDAPLRQGAQSSVPGHAIAETEINESPKEAMAAHAAAVLPEGRVAATIRTPGYPGRYQVFLC